LTYNDFGELAGQAASVSDEELYTVEYERDLLGRITQRRERINGEARLFSYDYDKAGRLISVNRSGLHQVTYTYDANGNRLSRQTSDGVDEAGTYDDQDRLVTYGNRSYEYTRNGELEAWIEGGVRTEFDYDAFGNLRQARLPGDVEIEYLIDGQNRRVGKRINGELVQGFLYQDPLNPVAELDGDGNIRAYFIYGSHPNVPDHMIRDGRRYRIFSDHLGSPRLIVDADTGETIQRLDYDEFGRVLQDTNPGFQPFGFAGGIYDQHTGLVRFGARDYDPYAGRWAVKDPILFDGDGPNVYAYALNDPINNHDIHGLRSVRSGDRSNRRSEQRFELIARERWRLELQCVLERLPDMRTAMDMLDGEPRRSGCRAWICPALPGEAGYDRMSLKDLKSGEIPGGACRIFESTYSVGGYSLVSGPVILPAGGRNECICVE
jgi:RHS repeat-associated protein